MSVPAVRATPCKLSCCLGTGLSAGQGVSESQALNQTTTTLPASHSMAATIHPSAVAEDSARLPTLAANPFAPPPPPPPPTNPMAPPSSFHLPAGNFILGTQPSEDELFRHALPAQPLTELLLHDEATAGFGQEPSLSVIQHGSAVTNAGLPYSVPATVDPASAQDILLHSRPAASDNVPGQATAADADAVTGSTEHSQSIATATVQQPASHGNGAQLPQLQRATSGMSTSLQQPAVTALGPFKTGSQHDAEQFRGKKREAKDCNDKRHDGVSKGHRGAPARPHNRVAHPVISKKHPSKTSASRQTGAGTDRFDRATAFEQSAAEVNKRPNRGKRSINCLQRSLK